MTDPLDPARSHIIHAPLRDVDPVVLYKILALRSAVFCVEQHCAYLDPDGVDLADGVEQWWIGDVYATLRTIPQHVRVAGETVDATCIGRVVCDPAHRGTGLSSRLMRAAIAPVGTYMLGAQLVKRRWYERFGFSASGDVYLEDGIPHVPMMRRASETG